MFTTKLQRRRHLRAGDVHRQPDVAHHAERFQANGGVARRVGVHRAERPGVAGEHRLDQIQRLAATDFADHDPVGPHAERIDEQIANRHLAAAVGPRRLGFEIDRVRLMELQVPSCLR